MATDAQINANRQNAQKSTGPKTGEGKAASSKNAGKHFFYSREFVVRDDERRDFEKLRDGLLAEYEPNSNVIYDLFLQLLHAAWNLHRIRRIEAEYFLESPNPYADEKLALQLETIARHRMRFERTHARVSKQIQEQLTNKAFAVESDSIPRTASALANLPLLHRTFRASEDDYLSPHAFLDRMNAQFQAQKQSSPASQT